jgi:D-alanyl-D-alanine dipeptidase
MRRLITPVAITTAALIAAGALGNAAADPTATTPTTPTAPTPATTAPRLLTVTGDADTTLPSNDAQALFTQAYRVQLSDALDDASAKATAIAAHEGLTLGTIENITEQSSTTVGDCLQPEFAAGEASGGVAQRAPVAKAKKKKKTKKVHAHSRGVALSITGRDDSDNADDDVYPCDVTASVTVSYTIQ